MCRTLIKLLTFILISTNQFLLADPLEMQDTQGLNDVAEYAITYSELYKQDKVSMDIKNKALSKDITNNELQDLQKQFLDQQEKLMLEAKNKVNLNDELFNKYKRPMELDIVAPTNEEKQ